MSPAQCRPLGKWVSASGGSVPDNAVEVGYDVHNMVYVGRANHNGEDIPGKIVCEYGLCYVPSDGLEIEYGSYEVLVTQPDCNYEWQHTTGSEIPSGAIQAGNTSDGEPLYIGRARHSGAMCCGKVIPSHGCVYVPYGGQEHSYSSYEILVI